MKNTKNSFFLTLLLSYLSLTVFVQRSLSQDTVSLQIDSAVADPYNYGTYKIYVYLNKIRPDSAKRDAHFEKLVENQNNYFLKEEITGDEIKLPALEIHTKDKRYQIILIDVGITSKKEYTIEFREPLPSVPRKALIFNLEGYSKDLIDKFERGKSENWKKSIEPKILQSDSTTDSFADIGFDLALSRKLPAKFEFNFDASITINRNDPNNHWKLNFYWRPIDLWLEKTHHIGLRPLSLTLQEEATQALKFHDLSVRVFTSVFVRPLNGIQPLFLTAGFDEALQISRDDKDYDDPRFNIQAQWGMVGLVGRGSSFTIDWQYWRRFEKIGDPKFDPAGKKERKYVELEFVLPILENKNLTVKYADGDVSPTFEKTTTVQLGLEILFGGERIFGPK